MSASLTMTAAHFDECRRRNLLQGRAQAVVRDLGFLVADIEKLTPREFQTRLDDVASDLRAAITAAEPSAPERLRTSVPCVPLPGVGEILAPQCQSPIQESAA